MKMPGGGKPRAEDRVLNPLPQRTAEPAGERNGESLFRAVEEVRGKVGLHGRLEQVLAFVALQLQIRGQRGQPFDQRMIHQRLADLEGVRHAGAIHLGVDVADQIGLEVEILNQRQRIFAVRSLRVPMEHRDGVVARQPRLERVAEEFAAHVVAQNGDAMEVGVHRIARQRLEGRFRAEDAWRPIGFRVGAAEQPEERPPKGLGNRRAKSFLGHVQSIPAIAAETLVAAIAGQRHGHMLSGELAHAVGGDRGTVRVGLVVDAGQVVDEVEIIAFDAIDEMPCRVAVRDLLRPRRLVVRRFGKCDRAGVDRLVRNLGHHGNHRARVHAARQERAQRHLGDHPQLDGFAQALDEFSARVRGAYRVVQRKPDIPKLLRRVDRGSAPERQRVRGRQLCRAGENGARLGNVPSAKYSSTACGSRSRASPPWASSDLSSEPKMNLPSGRNA